MCRESSNLACEQCGITASKHLPHTFQQHLDSPKHRNRVAWLAYASSKATSKPGISAPTAAGAAAAASDAAAASLAQPPAQADNGDCKQEAMAEGAGKPCRVCKPASNQPATHFMVRLSTQQLTKPC